jgi:hypothetical protein
VSRPNPFARPGETPQQTGGRFEAFWAKLLGTEPTIGSGNQWTAPMDVGDGKILWSLKHSSKDTLRWGSKRVKELMGEVRCHLKGDPDVIPGLALHEEDGSTWVVLSAEDFLRMERRTRARGLLQGVAVLSAGPRERAGRERVPVPGALLHADAERRGGRLDGLSRCAGDPGALSGLAWTADPSQERRLRGVI